MVSDKKLLYFLFFLFFFHFELNAQHVSIKKNNDPNNLRASSQGGKSIQYVGYPLSEVIHILFEIDMNKISIPDTIKNQLIDIQITDTIFLESRTYEKFVLKEISKIWNLKFQIVKKFSEEYVATKVNSSKLNPCYTINDGVKSSTRQINKTWYGYCVETKDLFQKINDWYGLNIYDQTFLKGRYNFIINNSDFNALLETIEYDYSIRLVREKIEVDFLTIKE